MKKMIAVIVDAYSTGKYLAPAFTARGYRCLHIQTSKKIPQVFSASFHPEHFFENIIVNNNLDDIASNLAKQPIKCVVAGSETGVFAADYLSESLGLKTNGTQKSAARYNKFEMIDTVQAAGIKTAKYFKTNEFGELKDWVNKHNQFPVVLKPLQSAGNDKVIFCHKLTEVENAFNAIVHSKNLFDQQNTGVLAQSFLEGTEYIVNTVSADGHHYVAEIWQCVKERVEGGGYLSVLEKLISADSEHAIELATYAKNVLDALDIRHGPGHFEIMLTKDGPILIEVAARLQGCVDPSAIEQATNDSQVSLTIDAYLAPATIINKALKPYQRKQAVYRIFILSHQTGRLSENPKTDFIKKLHSFFSINFSLHKNMQITKSINIATTLGYMHFINKDENALDEDYQQYKAFERNQLLRPAKA